MHGTQQPLPPTARYCGQPRSDSAALDAPLRAAASRLVPHRDRGAAPPVVLGSPARLDGDDEFASRAPVEQVADRRSDLAERIGAVDGRCEPARVDELSERHQVFGVLRGDEGAELLADERGQQERADLTIDATEPASIGLASDDDEPPPASERAPEV